MNKRQLQDANRGVRLLTGHMRATGESLDAAIAAGDNAAGYAMADPLVTVAAILIRQLKTALQSDTSTALERARTFCEPGYEEYRLVAAGLVDAIIAGEAPPGIDAGAGAVALGAQEIARGAACAIADISGEHRNAVVARLRSQLRAQGESVQISDKEGVEANMEEYAADPKMRQSRVDAAVSLVRAMRAAAGSLRNRAADMHEQGRIQERDSYEGVSRVTMTAAALGAGAIHLIDVDNHYPAYALLRQVVETEFVLWKFQHDPSSVAAWLNSDREKREQGWKPSRIYRDVDNDYRQKDYSGHCELGGHPTPTGTLLVMQQPSAVAEASLFGDLINHLKEAHAHVVTVADVLDKRSSSATQSIDNPSRAELENVLAHWGQTDRYMFSTTYFSDPLD
ncbi:hypothetical protein [Nocardia abscessus]|uniref:hypothetical protein n=1 Tax=Nocardia abscessus TaxID=120957 RepID=UPI0024571EBB|nr:hypothetical protein [Nocardia abscessus]